ncbi:MAG: 50S ribosome-binding GTPase [Candidatus Omnitrophica bacterium]|nr:50S ribosome-binding GTPase [Candidatus Omnitrophota bacterium]
MLIDHVHVLIQAGSGGNGCESFFRRTDKKLVPNGGDGGNGGAVIFQSSTNAPSLSSFRLRQHLIAESGGHGGSNRKRGKNGEDLIVRVPVGTRIMDRQRKFMIRDLAKDGEEVTILEGAKGGVGNYGGKQATQGNKGEILDLELSFRLMADFVLVGLPNSGKTAILNYLTRSQAKEESYPFSTKSPELGAYSISDMETVTLCELPSIYSGSHEGRGMGTGFLRHLENAKVILLVIDPASKFSESLSDGLKILRKEIEIYRKEFLEIPTAVVVNKMDLPEAKEKTKKFNAGKDVPKFLVSAKTGEGMAALGKFLKERYELATHA